MILRIKQDKTKGGRNITWRIKLDLMDLANCWSTVLRAFDKVRLPSTIIKRMASKILSICMRFGLALTGDISTTTNFSTCCGKFRAVYITAEPPILWPTRIALSKPRSLKSWTISPAISLYDMFDVCGESPWFLASTAMTYAFSFLSTTQNYFHRY